MRRTTVFGRLSTISADGTPHVVPVGYRLDAERSALEIDGIRLAANRKFQLGSGLASDHP
jgi:pyridoxamine 5'-phosphate oxidase family protein